MRGHLLRSLVLGAVLLWAAPCFAHSYGFKNVGGLKVGNPADGVGVTVWDTVPSSSTRGVCLGSGDGDYIYLAGIKTSNLSCIVECHVDTTSAELAGADRRLDSILIKWRIKDDGWSGRVSVAYDTAGGSLRFCDTVTATTSYVTHTSRAVTDLTKKYIYKLRLWVFSPDAVGLNDTLFVSSAQVIAYASDRSDEVLIYHDTADFRIGQISNNETFDDVWTGNRLFMGAYGADSVRLVLSIQNVDTLRTATAGAGFRRLDSALLFFMVDSVVGTPGYEEPRRPQPRANLTAARAIYRGRIDDDSICHTDWDHWHRAAEGASQTFCEDTIGWATYGIGSFDGDYVPSELDTTTFAQLATKRIDITQWISQINHTPADLPGPFTKYFYNGQAMLMPVAEYAAHVTRDTMEVSADGDTVAWGVRPGSGADYLYVDEVTPATDSIVGLQFASSSTEMFNFPDDTANGATLDSVRILIHARKTDAAGDCPRGAGDSIIVWYDTVSAAGHTRLSKFSPTTSWATYTSSKITFGSKAALVNLQAGFYNYWDDAGCFEETAWDSVQVAWIACERFYSTTNKRVKVGNVRPLTANDSSWIEVYYTDVGALHSNPSATPPNKVIVFGDTTKILMGYLIRGSGDPSLIDGLYGLNSYSQGQITSVADTFKNAVIMLRDTSMVVDSFPINKYRIDSAMLRLFVVSKGANVTKTTFHPIFRGWKVAPRRTRESVNTALPLTLVSNSSQMTTPTSNRLFRRSYNRDSLWTTADGSATPWVICGTCTGPDYAQVDERSQDGFSTTIDCRQAVEGSLQTEWMTVTQFGGAVDTVDWRNKSLLPDSIRVAYNAFMSNVPISGDSVRIWIDTTSGGVGDAVYLNNQALTTGVGAYFSKAIVPTRNLQQANLQVGIQSVLTAGQTARCTWIGVQRFFKGEYDSIYWASAGAKDSTTTDSADIAPAIDSVMWVSGDGPNKYVYRVDVKAWVDSIQHGYGASPTTKKWGNGLLLFTVSTQSGSTSSRLITENGIYPRQSDQNVSTELLVWATDTTTVAGTSPPKRRRKIIEGMGYLDKVDVLSATQWMPIENTTPYPEFERDTRRVYARKYK